MNVASKLEPISLAYLGKISLLRYINIRKCEAFGFLNKSFQAQQQRKVCSKGNSLRQGVAFVQ